MSKSTSEPAAAPVPEPVAGVTAEALDDPDFRNAVVDLLGVLAYGELTAFQRLADDVQLAPTINDKAELARFAVVEFGYFERLRDRIVELGADPQEAMDPFVAALDEFHRKTAPSSWYEGLVKAYVGDGIGKDFYRAMATYLDPDSRALVNEVLVDGGHVDFVVDRVRAAVAEDPRTGGRLALWGRRLLGEALAQAQRVAAERETLTPLFTGGPNRPGADLAVLSKIFSQLTEAHSRRMSALGLAA